MPSVGGFSTDFVKGAATPLRTTVHRWKPPGLNGVGYHDYGLGDSKFEFTLIKFETLANVEVWISNMMQLQGTLITIVDDQNITHNNCFVEQVAPPEPRFRRAALHPGGDYDTRAELRITGHVVA